MAKFRGRGCSPEMARRIIELLLNDSGISGQLAQKMTPRADARPKAATVESPQPANQVRTPRRRRSRKLTDAVVAFLHDRRDLPIPQLLLAVTERFGVTLSSGSVYKAWKIPRAA